MFFIPLYHMNLDEYISRKKVSFLKKFIKSIDKSVRLRYNIITVRDNLQVGKGH